MLKKLNPIPYLLSRLGYIPVEDAHAIWKDVEARARHYARILDRDEVTKQQMLRDHITMHQRLTLLNKELRERDEYIEHVTGEPSPFRKWRG